MEIYCMHFTNWHFITHVHVHTRTHAKERDDNGAGAILYNPCSLSDTSKTNSEKMPPNTHTHTQVCVRTHTNIHNLLIREKELCLETFQRIYVFGWSWIIHHYFLFSLHTLQEWWKEGGIKAEQNWKQEDNCKFSRQQWMFSILFLWTERMVWRNGFCAWFFCNVCESVD